MALNESPKPPQNGKPTRSHRLSRMRTRASELDGRGSWEEAAELRLEILQLDRKSIGNEHPNTLFDMHHLARTYNELGQLEKAETTYREVAATRKRVLGDEHPDTLKSLHGHAWILMKLGNLEEAQNILVQVVQSQKKVLGQDDSRTLMSMRDLAWAYLRAGKLEEAEKVSSHVVEVRRRVLGDDHPHSLDIMNNLATVYRQQNRLKETVELYRDIVDASERSLGSGHVDTLHSMRSLAAAYLAQEQLKEAEVLYDRIVSTHKEVLGEEHPDTLDSMNRLASTIFKQGRLNDAETVFLQVAEARDRVLGENHPSTLKSVHSLAMTYRQQGRLKEAEELFVRVVSGRKSVLGESHRDTIVSLDSLSGIYRKQARWQDAERSELELLEIRKKLFGEEHSSTFGSMRNLVRIYRHQKRRKEAEKYEAFLAERSSTFLKVPPVISRASSLASDRPESSPTSGPGSPRTKDHVPPPRSASSASSADKNRKKTTENAKSGKMKNPPSPKSPANLQVPKSPASDRSTSPSLSPIHYDAYSTIDHVIRELHICTLSFRYPDDLDFETSTPNSESVPKLAYTPKNRSFLEQISKLESLQEELDGIDSHGDGGVRQARKETGAAVERALADMEWARAVVWEKYNEDAAKGGGPNSSQDSDAFSIGASESSEHRITQNTSVDDVFEYLLAHGCSDCTSRLDLSQCSDRPIRGGTFGDVWRGKLTDQTQVAIKCLRLYTDMESSVKSVKRGARELYNWSKARHENILELTGIAMFRDQLAMISPWMGNETLSAYILKTPNADRWALCLQITKGLAYMHGIKMVHGDLKGSNIFISDEGVVKLGDFGHSISQYHSLSFTATTNLGGGTIRWMAPELMMGDDEEGSTDRSMPADVYALGMTILEVVTGKMPYSEVKSGNRVMKNVAEGKYPLRPGEMSSSTTCGDARWNMLLSCWNMKAGSRPTALKVRDMAHLLS